MNFRFLQRLPNLPNLILQPAMSRPNISAGLLELRNELSRAQLTALGMQLNPHFLFNALHTIGALVRDGNQGGTVEMIENLGAVLRCVLRTDGDPEVPLRDEIELVRGYVKSMLGGLHVDYRRAA